MRWRRHRGEFGMIEIRIQWVSEAAGSARRHGGRRRAGGRSACRVAGDSHAREAGYEAVLAQASAISPRCAAARRSSSPRSSRPATAASSSAPQASSRSAGTASSSDCSASANDAAYVRSVLASVKGPVVLVGHSYGGAVISEAATGEPHVKAQFPGSTLGENLNPVSFPIAAGALEEMATGAAWKTIPSWSLIAGFHRCSPVTLPRSYVQSLPLEISTLAYLKLATDSIGSGRFVHAVSVAGTGYSVPVRFVPVWKLACPHEISTTAATPTSHTRVDVRHTLTRRGVESTAPHGPRDRHVELFNFTP
ncbi:alpha/beta fold hydrolase [Streptomyces sp. NRRL WC-3723]|uniref:alpha/beta fold hydrolase n=1 Tax=Streptomyces sp. NRRL WC-3723 TaxID=1519491 RepID=UPI003B6366CA